MRTRDFSTATSKLLAVLVGLSLGFSACTSDESEATTPPASDEVAEITTTSSPVTITSTTDEAPETATAVDSLGKPLIEVPTEWDSDLDEIFGRYLLYWEALDIATGPPVADPDYAPLLDLLDSGVVSEIQAQIQEFVDANAVVVQPEGSLDDHGLRLPNPAPLGKTEGNRVVIQDCWIRDDIVQTLDGSTKVEHFRTLLWNVDMIVIDGEWRVFGVTEADDRSDGYQECQDLFDTLER